MINGIYFEVKLLIPSTCFEWPIFDKLLVLSGFLMVDPLMFISYHLRAIGLQVKVMLCFDKTIYHVHLPIVKALNLYFSSDAFT